MPTILRNSNLIVQNNVVAYTPTFTDNNPSTHVMVSSTHAYMIFKSQTVNHTFTVPVDGLNCDILMIGGGGGAGSQSGGGAGACIVARNQILPAGSCIVKVGAGGVARTTNGADSLISVGGTTRYLAKGGGYGGGTNAVGRAGGCGGGAGQNTNTVAESGGAAVTTNVVNGISNIGPSITSNYAVLGNSGGNNGTINNAAGGGGGIGAPGVGAGNGGNGAYQVTLTNPTTTINFRSHFANNANDFGVQWNGDLQYYIGGGGMGYNPNAGGWQANGAGGVGDPGVANTGSGGQPYGNGGSGIIIIRYIPKPMFDSDSSIELIRGTTSDANRDFKIGNYNGDFIVKSSLSGTNSDYIKMFGTNGAIYNFNNSLNWTQTSDRRIKENIERASYDKCYENISNLELNRFNYIKEFKSGNQDTNQLGFIAQEIKDIFPKAVFTNSYNSDDLNIQDLLSIDIGQINYTLYGAVKKLMEFNNDKEMRLKRLENLLNIEYVNDTSNLTIDTSNVPIDTSNLREL